MWPWAPKPSPTSAPSAREDAPEREASQGRHHPRRGATLQGTLTNWIRSIISSRQAERDKRILADRAGELYVNSSVAHGIVEGLIVEAVGTGLTPQPAPLVDWLGLDSEWQEVYERRAGALFEIFGFDPRKWCDAQHRLNAYQQQALAFAHWKLDGVGVSQVVFDESSSAPLRLSLLPIDPSRLQTPRDKINQDVYDGIRVDAKGAPVSVFIRNPPKTPGAVLPASGPSSEYREIPIRHAETGLPQILLTCDVRNVAEYRQDSILGPVVKEIRDNDDFVEAALIKSLIANLFSIFVAEENPISMPGAPQAASRKLVNWQARMMELERGLVLQGEPGQKPTVIPNDAPGPNYEMMWRSILARLGMATQRGPENISRAYTSSYSASMASMENADRFNDYDRSILVSGFCQPWWAWQQYEAALRGLLPIRSREHFVANLHAYTRADWLPPPARPIDKVKAAESDRLRLETNTDTLASIAGRQNRSWRALLRQRAIELAEAKKLEEEFQVSLSPLPASQSRPVPAEPSAEPGAAPSQEPTP